MACCTDGPLETCSCKTDLPDLLLTYLNASWLSKGDLLSLSVAFFLASLLAISETAAIMDLLINIQCLDFDAQHLNVPVKSIAGCWNISAHVVKKHKQ